MYIDITYQNIPETYRLFATKKGDIVIDIKASALDKMVDEEDIEFKGIFEIEEIQKGFVRLIFELPELENREEYLTILEDFSKDFSCLLEKLKDSMEKEDDGNHQSILLSTWAGQNGRDNEKWIDGQIGKEMTAWLKCLENDEETLAEIHEKVMSLMLKAHKKIRGYENDSRFSFGISNGGFIITCPGDACGIHPSCWPENSSDEGFGIETHNADTAEEQYYLLLGFLTLCRMFIEHQEKTTPI